MRGYQLIKKIQNGVINNCKVRYGYVRPYTDHIEVKDKMLMWEPNTFSTKCLTDWQMNFEVDVTILTEEERKYLANVIRPFKNQIRSISKISCPGGTKEFISMDLVNSPTFNMPNFSKYQEVYKGMEPNREYTLEELKLVDELPF